MGYSSGSEQGPSPPSHPVRWELSGPLWRIPLSRALCPDATTQEYQVRREDGGKALPFPWSRPTHSLPRHGAPDRSTSSECPPQHPPGLIPSLLAEMSHNATRLPMFPHYLRFRALIAQHFSDGLEGGGREVEPVSSALMSIVPKQP